MTGHTNFLKVTPHKNFSLLNQCGPDAILVLIHQTWLYVFVYVWLFVVVYSFIFFLHRSSPNLRTWLSLAKTRFMKMIFLT